LHSQSREVGQHLHDVIVRAAIHQEAAIEAGRGNGEEHLFLSYDVSVDFPAVVKQVLRGDISVRFDAEMQQAWDLEEVLREHEGEWLNEFEHVFTMGDVDEPPEGWSAARRSYTEIVDWTERMDRFDMLMATA
jgi:hypothetical protein